MFTTQWVVRPIVRLSSASKDIANGELPQVIPAETIDELQVLAQSQNAIAVRLKASFAALEEANEQLEQRVEERTAELRKHTSRLRQVGDFEAMLKRVTDRVRNSLDEVQILQVVVKELACVLAVRCCAAALYDPQQRTFVIDYEYADPLGPSSLDYQVLPEDFPDTRLFQGDYLQFCRLGTPDRPRSAVLVCPVFDNEGLLCYLWLFCEPTRTYDDLEIGLVQQVSNQCAIAVHQARLYGLAQLRVEELKNLHRLKDDFLNTASHEIRTPIANMKLAVHMLKLSSVPERRQQYLDILQSECDRECALINDLLDLQRLEAGRYVTTNEPIALRELVAELVKSFALRIQDRGQSFEIDLPPQILPVPSHQVSVERVLSELLNNACKYTPLGGGIRFGLQQQCNPGAPGGDTSVRTRFEVANQAQIPADELQHIFEKFYRAHSSERQGGTGLGLALVQKLVKQLGGELYVESRDGWTTFTVMLGEQLS